MGLSSPGCQPRNLREKEALALDWKLWDRIAETHPLIHQLTNVVTVNDCANITLACGASPVMADAPEEAAEMAAASDAVVINIGTDRKSTRLNSSHVKISYAVFCLKKKK